MWRPAKPRRMVHIAKKAPCLAYEVLLPGHDGAIDDYAYLQYWNLTDHYLDQAATANRDRLDYHRKAFRYAEQSALEMLPRVPAAAKTPPPVAA